MAISVDFYCSPLEGLSLDFLLLLHNVTRNRSQLDMLLLKIFYVHVFMQLRTAFRTDWNSVHIRRILTHLQKNGFFLWLQIFLQNGFQNSSHMTLGSESGLKNRFAHLHKNMDLENFQKMDEAGAVQLGPGAALVAFVVDQQIENRGQSLQRQFKERKLLKGHRVPKLPNLNDGTHMHVMTSVTRSRHIYVMTGHHICDDRLWRLGNQHT